MTDLNENGSSTGSNQQSTNRGLQNAANRLQSNATRNRQRGLTNSADRLQSNAERLRERSVGGVTPEQAANGVLPSEAGRAQSGRTGSQNSTTSGTTSQRWNPALQGANKPGWIPTTGSGSQPTNPPPLDPAGTYNESTVSGGDSGVPNRFGIDNGSSNTIRRSGATARDGNDNGVLDSIEPYQADPANSFSSPTQDNGRVSPRDWNANTDTIDPVSENTNDALERTGDSDFDYTNSFDNVDDPSDSSMDDDDGSYSRPLDADGDGINDSIQPYQFDPADTVSPTQDNGRVSPRDWNANTDTIDPVSENTLDALDGNDESNATDASADGTGLSTDATTGSTTTDDTTTGTTDSSFQSEVDGTTSSGFRRSTATSGDTSLRRSGTTTRRSSGTSSSSQPRTSGLEADVDVDASIRTPGLQRAARLLGTSSGQSGTTRGLDRARSRASSRAEQGLDRATERLESNSTRFQDRFNLDE